MATVVDRIIEQVETSKQAADEAYTALVKSLAAGEDADAQHCVDVVCECGKTLDDLRDDVARREDRLAAAALLAERAERSRRYHDARGQVERLRRQRDAAVENWNRQIAQAEQSATEANEQVREVDAAEQVLRNSAPPELREQRAALTTERDELNRRKKRLVGDLRAERDRLAEAETAIGNPPGNPRNMMAADVYYRLRREAAIDARDRIAKLVAKAEADLARLDSRLDEIEMELADIAAEELKP